MKIKNRILAGVSAAIMAVGVASVLPVSYLSVSAMQIPAYSNTTGKISGFEYTVKVEKVSTTRVKVVFEILNNPGYKDFSIAIKSDAKFVDGSSYMLVNGYSESTKTLVSSTVIVGEGKVERRCLNLEYIYDISANPNKSYDFSVGVLDYISPVENINYHAGNDGDSSYDRTLAGLQEGVNVESNNKTVLLGDANNDGKIAIQDASDIMSVISKCEKNGLDCIRTAVLNKYLKSNYDQWKTQFPNLVCAEAIDVDFDAKITEEDGNQVLEYYSKVYAGSQVVGSLIGKKQAITVVYDN